MINDREYFDVVFLDVCGTIVKENTTHELIREIAKKRVMIHLYLSIWGRLIGKILNIIKRRDVYREFLIRSSIKGLTDVELIAHVHAMIPRLTFKTQFLRDVKLRHPNAEIILLSASLAPIISSICTNGNFDGWFSTELEFDDQKYTGNLKRDLFNRKNEILERFSDRRTIFYSDNPEDRTCRAYVDRFVVV